MRIFAAVLLLAALSRAEDPKVDFQTALLSFQKASQEIDAPGFSAKINPAIEDLVATGDIRSLGPFAALIVQSFTLDDKAQEQVKVLQHKGADARDKAQALQRDLEHLKLREQAGAKDVGPLILKNNAEREQLKTTFSQVALALRDLGKRITDLRDLRAKLENACSRILESQTKKAASQGVGAMRAYLDLADRREALLLVDVLRLSGNRAVAPQLADVISYPRAPEAVVLKAALALAPLRDPAGTRVLADLWMRKPKTLGPYIQNALSLAAQKSLQSPAEAEAWAKTLADADAHEKAPASHG